jgi:hypothetical protein
VSDQCRPAVVSHVHHQTYEQEQEQAKGALDRLLGTMPATIRACAPADSRRTFNCRDSIPLALEGAAPARVTLVTRRLPDQRICAALVNHLWLTYAFS